MKKLILLLVGCLVVHGSVNALSELHHAVSLGNDNKVKYLIARGADVNNQQSELNSTPLHLAAQGTGPKALIIVQILLESGANVDLQDRLGYIPLQLAINLDIFALIARAVRKKHAPREILSLLMAKHGRAGANSPANTLTEDAYRLIFGYLKLV